MAAMAAACPAFALGMPNLKPVSSGKFQQGPTGISIEKTASTRASGAIDFSYAESPYTAYSLSSMVKAGSRFCLLIELSPEDIKAYAGNQVTGATIYSPSDYNGTKNTITEARFFYSTDLKSEEYTQDIKLSKTAFSDNDITIDQPYTISGDEKSLYFGYSFIIPKNNDMYYIVVDGQPNNYPGSLIFGYSTDGQFPTQFDDSAAADIGALCMSLKIEGDNLPENIASLAAVDTPSYLPLSGDGANIDFMVQNKAANDLSSVEVTASVTGMPDVVQTFDFSPLSFGKTAVLTLNGVKAKEAAFVDLSMKITKVNGVPFDGNLYQAVVPAYDQGYTKMIVAEDATGTWCGWCPGGIEALEYLKAICPDRAIAIGVHNGDPMAIDEYQKFIEAYVGGFPNVLYNRYISQTPTDTYKGVCQFIDQVVAFFDFPSYAQVTLNGKSSEDGQTASVTASAEFAVGTSVPHYLSFVIVEDGVGPYIQQNYYKTQQVAMNGWEKKAAKVSVTFNDVARYYNCFPGISNSLPSVIEPNVVNEYTIEMPLSSVTGNEYRVVALLTNGMTGEIINAAEYSMSKDNSIGTGVEDITEENAAVEYFNLNGQKVANPSNGIFIRHQGSKTEKVVIR